MQSRKEDKVEKEREEKKEQQRKPYRPPKLRKFGPVEEFTGRVPS
jgi:hypothetical protein